MTQADSLAVFIATTSGPVEIQRITEEDPDIDSVVCLAGKAMPLPISHAYQNFVHQPTGVIQRDFGHGSYRVDLASTVDDGYSWQLALYLGHAAVSAQRFTTGDSAPARAVIATGEVNVDLMVLPVDHIATKLAAIKETVDSLIADGVEVDILVPRECMELVPDGYGNIRAVGDVAEALEVLGLRSLEPSASPTALVAAGATARASTGRSARKLLIGLVVLLAMVGGAIAVYLSSINDWRVPQAQGDSGQVKAVVKPTSGGDSRNSGTINTAPEQTVESSADARNVRLRLVEFRAPEGSSCAAVRFGQTKPLIAERMPSADGVFSKSLFAGLCRIEFFAEGPAAAYLWGRFERWPAGGSEVFQNEAKGPTLRRLDWRIEMPRELTRDFDMRLMVVSGERPLDGTSGWLADKLPKPGPHHDAGKFIESADALSEMGMEIVQARLRLSRNQ